MVPTTFDSIRSAITDLLDEVKLVGDGLGSPAIQEVILAQRHLEDARMRLGVALAYQRGMNPWTNKVKETK